MPPVPALTSAVTKSSKAPLVYFLKPAILWRIGSSMEQQLVNHRIHSELQNRQLRVKENHDRRHKSIALRKAVRIH